MTEFHNFLLVTLCVVDQCGFSIRPVDSTMRDLLARPNPDMEDFLATKLGKAPRNPIVVSRRRSGFTVSCSG